MYDEIPFSVEIPVTFFEKAGAGPKIRRIGGLISTESPDRQEEVILQQGLDFSDFLSNGWYNDNHSKETTGIVGYPELVKTFKSGQLLPSGDVALNNGTWAEGYLLDTERANKIWELGKALQGTGRNLGYSLEGSIKKRLGRLRKTIAKARVRNVAITNCPVNIEAGLDILAKSLMAVTNAEPEFWMKALGMGTPVTPGAAPVGPQTGIGAGQVLAPESLEQDGQLRLILDDEDEDKEAKKSMSDLEAMAWIVARRPGMALDQALRFVTLTKALKCRGRI